jgi:hypothetical protein
MLTVAPPAQAGPARAVFDNGETVDGTVTAGQQAGAGAAAWTRSRTP